MNEADEIRLPRSGSPFINFAFALLMLSLFVLFTLKAAIGVVTYPLQFAFIGVDKLLEKRKQKKQRKKAALKRAQRRNQRVQEKVRLMRSVRFMHPFEDP